VGSLGRNHRRPHRDPGLDGAQLHRPGASRQTSIRLAGDGAPPGAGPHRRRVVPLVVRPGHRRGPRRLPVHRRDVERYPRRPAAGAPVCAFGRRGDGQRGPGGVHRPALPGLRLLSALPAGADDPAPGPHRHPAGAGAHRSGAVDSASYGGLGPPLAAPVYDHRVPAGGAAHRRGVGLRLPGRVRRHRPVRAGAGPGLEAAHGHRLHVPGEPRPLDAGQSRHLRRLAAHPLLRDVPARLHGPLGPRPGVDWGRSRRRPGGRGGRGGSGGWSHRSGQRRRKRGELGRPERHPGRPGRTHARSQGP